MQSQSCRELCNDLPILRPPLFDNVFIMEFAYSKLGPQSRFDPLYYKMYGNQKAIVQCFLTKIFDLFICLMLLVRLHFSKSFIL